MITKIQKIIKEKNTSKKYIIIRESEYKNIKENVKIKIKARFVIEDMKIKEVELYPDTKYIFHVKNYFARLFQDTDWDDLYRDFINYVVYDLEKENNLKLSSSTKHLDGIMLPVNGISFFNKEDIERVDEHVVIDRRK